MDAKNSLLIQSHFSLVWWAQSLLSGYFQSSEFKNISFTDKFVQDQLARPGIAAGALVAPSLYVALVIPKEIIFDECASDFLAIDNFIAGKVNVVEKTYPKKNVIPYTRHLRNATSHARIEITNEGIEFEDENSRKGYVLKARIDFLTLSEVIQRLNLLIRRYIDKTQPVKS